VARRRATFPIERPSSIDAAALRSCPMRLGTTVTHCISPLGGYWRDGGGTGLPSLVCGGGGVGILEGTRDVGGAATGGGRGLAGTFVTAPCAFVLVPAFVWAAKSRAGPFDNIRAAIATTRIPSRLGFMCPASAPDCCGRKCTTDSIRTRRQNVRKMLEDGSNRVVVRLSRWRDRYPIG
jgi:hypothetical protein